uniref:Chromo domain-containing protein n=1 Tax=Mycena chlorophos TaxID=658473 RepID=A0ABQ0LJZ0_MYCCL|nr:predicted protein [Mycena chlorophos]
MVCIHPQSTTRGNHEGTDSTLQRSSRRLGLPRQGIHSAFVELWTQRALKWAGWSKKYNTWEPIEHLLSCLPLLARFWQNVSGGPRQFMTNRAGYLVSPPAEYIQQEKERFARDFPDAEVAAQNADPRRSKREWVNDPLEPGSKSMSPLTDLSEDEEDAAPGSSKGVKNAPSKKRGGKSKTETKDKGKGKATEPQPVSDMDVPGTSSSGTRDEAEPEFVVDEVPNPTGLLYFFDKPVAPTGIRTKRRLAQHMMAPTLNHVRPKNNKSVADMDLHEDSGDGNQDLDPMDVDASGGKTPYGPRLYDDIDAIQFETADTGQFDPDTEEGFHKLLLEAAQDKVDEEKVEDLLNLYLNLDPKN